MNTCVFKRISTMKISAHPNWYNGTMPKINGIYVHNSDTPITYQFHAIFFEGVRKNCHLQM